MAKTYKPALSELESKVLAIVWEHDEVTAEQVRTKIKLASPPKESTIRTILSRLKTKGYVKHETRERAYFYSATDRSQNVAADAIRGIIDRICKGSVESLLVGLVNREVISPAKLRELAEKIDNGQAAASKPKQPTAKSKTRRKGT